MNSFSEQIANELQSLKNKGAEIPDKIIALARNGRTDLGAMAVDKLSGKFDVSYLSNLSNQASREEYPEYWAKVDAMGGWKKDDFSHNMRVFDSVFS